MKVILNGEKNDIKENLTVRGLLAELKIESQRVAVEVNMKIIKKADYDGHVLNEGDAIEVVSFVGGG